MSPAEAALLTESRSAADAFEETVRLACPDGVEKARARAVAHWFIGDVARLLHQEGGEVELSATPLTSPRISRSS